MGEIVDCMNHGRKPTTFVCRHVANSLLTRQPVGFFWSIDDGQEFPDAWCAECEARHARCGHEWVGEALAELGARILCSGCYLDARRMALGR